MATPPNIESIGNYVKAVPFDHFGPVYVLTFSAIAVSAAQDVFELNVASTLRGAYLREVRIGQYSDAGDAAAELLSVLVIKGYTVSGSGGAAVTPTPIDARSAAAASTACREFTTYLSNFDCTAPSTDIESIPLFGGAYVQKENPREPIEMSFDFVMTYAEGLLFAQLLMSSTVDGSTGPAESKNEGTDKVIYVQALTGSTYYTHAMNNARCVSMDKSLSADGYMTGKVTFKATPATADATPKSNYKEDDVAAGSITWS